MISCWHDNVEKPIISLARTNTKSIISPAPTVPSFVVYPTQTPCFHSVPLVRRLVAGAGVCGTGVRLSQASKAASKAIITYYQYGPD